MIKGGKRGQVTIFIIIAILIVAIVALIFLYYPKIFSVKGTESSNPAAYIQKCVVEELENNIEIIRLQGGNYVTNENTGYFYKKNDREDGTHVRYLCYVNYVNNELPQRTCINQEPFLNKHIEFEIRDSIKETTDICFENLKKSYEDKGYSVILDRGELYVKILPEKILTDFNSTFSIKKQDESETFKEFKIETKSNLHNFIEITKSILIWEMNLGDSIPELYMYDNPYMRVEKHKKGDGIKVYIITDINTGEDFRFASKNQIYI